MGNGSDRKYYRDGKYYSDAIVLYRLVWEMSVVKCDVVLQFHGSKQIKLSLLGGGSAQISCRMFYVLYETSLPHKFSFPDHQDVNGRCQ